MSELKNHIVAAGLNISDPLHTLNILQALPASYETIQQIILATIADFTTINWVNIWSCILSEELRQISQPNISAICPKSSNNKDKCNHCGGTGHWEKDCCCKACGLSQEEAQAERKGGNKKKGGKGKEEEKKEMNPSVSTIITDDKPNPPNGTSTVPITKSNDTVCFYIVCDHEWMLDSGCTDYITNDISDFAEYQLLPTPHKAYFANKVAHVSYIGNGTISGKTWVNGQEKTIILQDILHSPEIGGQFFLILKIDRKGFVTTFLGSCATISWNGMPYAKGHVRGQH